MSDEQDRPEGQQDDPNRVVQSNEEMQRAAQEAQQGRAVGDDPHDEDEDLEGDEQGDDA